MFSTGYRAPEATHPDWFKMALVNSVLAGASAPGGSGIGNRTSRLYKALVETELAAGVGRQPVPVGRSVPVQHRRDGARWPHAGGRSRRRWTPNWTGCATGSITQAELDKAKKQAKALFAYGTESVTGQAFWLAFAENFSSYTWYENYLEQLEAVTLDEVNEAARRYLRRVTADGGLVYSNEWRQSESVMNMHIEALPGPDDITRRELPNGIVVLVRENHHAPSVVITGSLDAGSLFEPPELSGLASFTASMLLRGTRERAISRRFTKCWRATGRVCRSAGDGIRSGSAARVWRKTCRC